MSLNRGQIPVLGHGGFEQTIEILKCLDYHQFESLPHKEKRVVENDGFSKEAAPKDKTPQRHREQHFQTTFWGVFVWKYGRVFLLMSLKKIQFTIHLQVMVRPQVGNKPLIKSDPWAKILQCLN